MPLSGGEMETGPDQEINRIFKKSAFSVRIRLAFAGGFD
jgi:hypothetical protein